MAHYVHDDKNNRIEALSKEEIYALLAAAIQQGQLPSVDEDTAFVTMIKSIVDGVTYKLGFCTQAQYNSLEAQGLLEANAYYFIIDDTSYDDLETYLNTVATTLANLKVYGLGSIVNGGTQVYIACDGTEAQPYEAIVKVDNEGKVSLISQNYDTNDGVTLILNGSTKEIKAIKRTNGVVEKELDLFTELDNRIPLTIGTNNNAITYLGLYRIRQNSTGKALIMSIESLTTDCSLSIIRGMYTNGIVNSWDVITFDRQTNKFIWKLHSSNETGGTESTITDFTWKLLIKY